MVVRVLVRNRHEREERWAGRTPPFLGGCVRSEWRHRQSSGERDLVDASRAVARGVAAATGGDLVATLPRKGVRPAAPNGRGWANTRWQWSIRTAARTT